jgi:methyltransferase (TIGR00027 family)
MGATVAIADGKASARSWTHADTGWPPARFARFEGAAASRAFSRRSREPGARNPDHLAERLLGGATTLFLWPGVRELLFILYRRALPGLHEFNNVRTREFDRVLALELDAGVRQLVLLGCGFDTRAHRFANRLTAAHVFELDHAAVHRWKQQRLGSPELPPTAFRACIDCDPSRELPTDALKCTQFDFDAPALFLCEGITPYLHPDFVADVLRFIGTRCARGSSIVFDYVARSALRPGSGLPGADEYLRYVARKGEPLRFGLPPDPAPELRRYGLTLETDRGATDLVREHHPAALAEPFGGVLGFMGVIHARRRT